MKYLLKLRYVGTNFCGFQVQPCMRTVQSTLQDAIEKIFKIRYGVKGCSRTDSGVHANVYYATFELPSDSGVQIAPEHLPFALNSVLPSDIVVNDAFVVCDDFHVRHNVASKEYVYLIRASRFPDPFLNERVFYINREISDDEIAKMNDVADALCGKHDFRCFMANGSPVASTVRDIKYVNVIRSDENIVIRACADGFLYNMVRIIAGTLISAARGKTTRDDVIKMLESGDRSLAGPTLPACGLYLNRVDFDKKYF